MATTRKFEINSGVVDATYEYIWKLHNLLLVTQDEARLAEEKFETDIGGCKNAPSSKWLVGLKEERKFLLYLRLLEKTGDDSKVTTRTSVGVQLPTSGEIVYWKTVERATAKNEEFTFDLESLLKDFIDKDKMLDNGTFTLSIKVELLTIQTKQLPNPARCLQDIEKASLKRAHCNYSKLLEDSHSHDTKIKCNDGVELGAHKIILSAQNPVFASMFQSDLSENRTGVINVEDVAGKTMKIILHYLYTGEILSEWSKPDTIVEFTYAAGKYQLTEILELLDGVLGSDDDDSTCILALLDLANKLSLKTAEKRLMQRFVRLTCAAKCSKDIFAIFGSGQ